MAQCRLAGVNHKPTPPRDRSDRTGKSVASTLQETRMLRPRTTAIATTLAAGLVAATGAGVTATAAPGHHTQAAPTAKRMTVTTHHKKLGTYLVDGNGDSLYLFEKDEHSTKSHCYHRCAKEWPAAITDGTPMAAGKVKSGLLGTTTRKNGKMQVTYNGHPLYSFADDAQPGQTQGEGLHEFGAEWNVVNKKGHEIEHDHERGDT
jgi:predicted lipoprotein with Yx(FWY)xxD motif